jgi:hypothetical protein
MQLFSTSVEKAGAELLKLRANRARLESKEIAAELEVTQLRAVTADQLADSILSEEEQGQHPGGRLAVAEARLSDIRKAHPAIIVRMKAAMVALGKALAEELRTKARKLQARRDKLESDRTRSLEQLADLEGSDRAIFIQTYHARRGFLPLGLGATLGSVAAPAFDKLDVEISQLLRQADVCERDAEQRAAGGHISGENLGSLLSVCSDSEQIPPIANEITKWYESATRAAAQAWVNSPQGVPIGGEPDPLPARPLFTIAWRAGVLDVAASGWINQELRRPTSKDHLYGPQGGRHQAYVQASAEVTRGVEAA